MAVLADGRPDTELRRYVGQVSYPARKDQVIHAARQAGAPSDMVENLQRMAVNDFNNADEVIQAYGFMP